MLHVELTDEHKDTIEAALYFLRRSDRIEMHGDQLVRIDSALDALKAALQAPAQDGVGADGLLPCPFCGSARGEWFVNYADVLGVYVSCNECGARTDYLEDSSTAIAAWNRRTSQPADAALIVDAPDKYGTVAIWPFGKDARASRVEVHYKDDGSLWGIIWRDRLMSIDDTRQYARALLRAVEIASQRPGDAPGGEG